MLIEVAGSYYVQVEDTTDEAIARRAAYCHVYSEESLGELTTTEQISVVGAYTKVINVIRIRAINV